MTDTLFASEDRLYQALLDRDIAFVPHAYVGVTSTGIFCRLDCSAKKPKRENCQFYPTIADCLEAGFRPCKRCKPMDHAGGGDPLIEMLMTALKANPEHRWSEADLTARGHDPSTVRRAFKRQFGMTFLDIARQTRLGQALDSLEGGSRVIDAQLDAGFDSASGFRGAVAKLIGIAPGCLSDKARLKVARLETALGPMVTVVDDTAVHLLEFMDRKGLAREMQKLHGATPGGLGLGRTALTHELETQLAAFMAGERAIFDLPLVLHGTEFQRRVWRALGDIPAGETRSYGDLARTLGQPSAVRAVARANGANQLAIIIPCHRVIGADGSLTGYAGGLHRKEKLIRLEAAYQ